MKRFWFFLAKHRIPIFGIILTALAIAGLIAALFLSSQLLEQEQRGLFITLSSAALGGLFTLIGVVITWSLSIRSEKKRNQEANRPEIYSPTKYDLAEAAQIKLCQDGEKPPIICNRLFYLKNSRKAPFRICGLRSSTGKMFRSKSKPFIEPDELFCLAFFCDEVVECFTLSIMSLDDVVYDFEIKLEEGALSVNQGGSYVSNQH